MSRRHARMPALLMAVAEAMMISIVLTQIAGRPRARLRGTKRGARRKKGELRVSQAKAERR